jgi:hypothetical protein
VPALGPAHCSSFQLLAMKPRASTFAIWRVMCALVSHTVPLLDRIVTCSGHRHDIGARVLPAKISSPGRYPANIRFPANEVRTIIAKPNFALHASKRSGFLDECTRSVRGNFEQPARLWNEAGGYGPYPIIIANPCTLQLDILHAGWRRIGHQHNCGGCSGRNHAN